MQKDLRLKKRIIVLIGGDTRYEQFAEISSLFEKHLYEKGYYVSLCTSHKGDEYIERILSYQPEGVIVLTSTLDTGQLNHIASGGVAVVLVNNIFYRDLDKRIAEIRPDSFGGIAKATEYLIEKGHKKISFFYGLPIKDNKAGNYRLQGYISAMKVKNLKPDVTRMKTAPFQIILLFVLVSRLFRSSFAWRIIEP